MSRKKFATIVAALFALALIAAACGDSGSSSSGNEGGGGGTDGPCPGTKGCIPEFPDGDIKIGIISGGDTNDGGYYESFVTSAEAYAEEKGWELIVLDRVSEADAAEQARNLCRQGVNFIALADGASVDAFPVAEEEVCKGVVFFFNGDDEITNYVFNTTDDINESQVAAGYATGLVMKELGLKKAAFIGGPDLDFVTMAFNGWTAGIKELIPDATTTKTLTGSFDDSALGQEAAASQISGGAEFLYPYMGGATNAVAKAGSDKGIFSIAPGTDRCDDKAFAAASLFPPGEFLLQGIQAWENGEARMGESFMNQVGVTAFPSAKICDNGNVPKAKELQAELDAFMKKIGTGEVDVEKIVNG